MEGYKKQKTSKFSPINMKKTLSILVLILFIISNILTPISAFAQEAQSSQEAALGSPSPSFVTPTPFDSGQEAPTPAVNAPALEPTALTPEENAYLLELQNEPVSNSSAGLSTPAIIRKIVKKNYKSGEKVSVVVDNAKAQNLSIKLFDQGGREVTYNAEELSDEYPAVLKIYPKRAFKPGKYRLVIKDELTGVSSSQDFTWGVLALNTNKSIYAPDETARLHMAVLDNQGEMVCNAKLEVKITDTNNNVTTFSTEDESIKVNPECQKKSFTLNPDFEASYKLGAVGAYNIAVTAITKDGTFSITDAIEVRDFVPFDVERTTATRIYPPEVYPVTFNITANQDFEGTISEIVPVDFAISQSSGVRSFSKITTILAQQSDYEFSEAQIFNIQPPFNGNFAVTQKFGGQHKDPLLGKQYTSFGVVGHDGIDFDLPTGTPVLSVDAGQVLVSQENGDYGTTVIIQHPWGRSYYGHLSKTKKNTGENVKKGEEIALSGSTGLATGPHLHFGIKPNKNDPENGYFGKVDPIGYFAMYSEKQSIASSSATAITGAKSEVVNGTEDIPVKKIDWDVSVKKGEKINLGYSFKAPLTSPEFYLLGTLEFRDKNNVLDFEEARQWQIASDAPQKTHVIASIPRSTMSVTTERVGGTDAHVVAINSPDQTPSYKYQFLAGGLRLFVDRKDGAGWVQLVSEVQPEPEYLRQQGPAGNSQWRQYSLSTNTTGANVLKGFDRQDQKDGSTKFIKTYSTDEEGIVEIFKEEWHVPKEAEDLASKGPKATYSMSKNRGIVLNQGVQEGTWRMRWSISGISDITKDKSDIKDDENKPPRRKEYKEFAIDVEDFDKLFTSPDFSFSELAVGKKAEILFYKNGTTDERIIDPTLIVDNTASLWTDNHQRNVFYNGSVYCVFYDKNSTSLFAKCGDTLANMAAASEQTVLNALKTAPASSWDIYMVNDTKFDIGYEDNAGAGQMNATTCSLTGSTISCSAESATSAQSNMNEVAIGRTGSDRIWMYGGTSSDVISADQTGDSNNITSWTLEDNDLTTGQSVTPLLIPYQSSDKILVVGEENRATAAQEGLYYGTCLQSDSTSCAVYANIVLFSNPTVDHLGNGIRISDTDFRIVYVNASNSDVIEAKFDGTSTWTAAHATISTGTYKNPSIFYDRLSDVGYVVYADSADDIWYRSKTCMSGVGCTEGTWGAETNADGNEAGANTFPVTQMMEPPVGSTRVGARNFPWCYRSADTNFDLICDSINLWPATEEIMRHGKWFDDVGVERKFTF